MHAQGQEASGEAKKEQWVRVALALQDGKTTYASTTFMVNGTSKAWELYNATLSPHETDTSAKLTITFEVCKAYCPSLSALIPFGQTRSCLFP